MAVAAKAETGFHDLDIDGLFVDPRYFDAHYNAVVIFKNLSAGIAQLRVGK